VKETHQCECLISCDSWSSLNELEFLMLWNARLKRIKQAGYPYSLHEGANYVKQAVFSNLRLHMTGPANECILAERAMTLPMTLSGGVLFAN